MESAFTWFIPRAEGLLTFWLLPPWPSAYLELFFETVFPVAVFIESKFIL